MEIVFGFLNGFMTASLAALWYFALKDFKKLPEIVPTKFDLQGNPENYGSKYLLFIYPILGSLMFGFLAFPDSFGHFPVKITPENKATQVLIGQLVAKSINCYCLILFALIVKHTVKFVLEKEKIKPFPVLLWLGILAVIIIFFISLANIYK